MKKVLSYLLGAIVPFTMAAMPAFAADEGSWLEELDVKGVQVTAYDGSALVEWDAVDTYDGEVAGYQVHYGLEAADEQGEIYENVEEAGNVTSYLVEDIDNDTEYFFSVIAYSDDGNESMNWAVPLVSASPSEDDGNYSDDEAPQVSEAEALNSTEVKIVFSESVVLPDEDAADSFLIENSDDFEPLSVEDAVIDEDDETGATVILTTEAQELDAEYQITVTMDVTDESGNPIISGTSDTATFTGTDLEKEDGDVDAPRITEFSVLDSKTIVLNFDESVVFSVDPSDDFMIVSVEDADKTLEILNLVVGENADGVENASVVITTDKHENTEYMLTVSTVVDLAGNEISSDDNSFTFNGLAPMGGWGDDDDDDDDGVISPADAANFIAKAMEVAEETVVKLTWDIDESTVGNIVEQLLYMSDDKGADYEKEATLDADVTEYEVSGLADGEYWFKLTQVDEDGNESEGVISKITLSETGPELLGLVAISLGLGRLVTRRKKQ